VSIQRWPAVGLHDQVVRALAAGQMPADVAAAQG
jgi:hypothetical protein